MTRIVTDGLVFYAPMYRTTLNASPFTSADTNHHSCTITGATWTSQGRSFDAVDDLISIADSAQLSFGNGTTDVPFSFIVWTKMTDATSHVIMTKGTLNKREYHCYCNGSDKLEIDLHNKGLGGGANLLYTYSDAAITAYEGSFVMLGWTYDGLGLTTSTKLYVNGTLVASTSAKGGSYVAMNDYDRPLRMHGSWEDGPEFSAATVGEVIMYRNRVLVAGEMAQNYNATKWKYELASTATFYEVNVDWDNDTNPDIYDDITRDVKSALFSRGKSDELGKAEVGECLLTLNNDDALYTPSNSSSALYGELLLKRPVSIKATLSGTTYDLFYGFIEEIIPHPHLSEQDCNITAIDGLDFLSRHDMATALYKNALTGTIHGYILDDAGWSATMRTLDTGQDTVPYWYGYDVKARFAQEAIDDSEQGFSYIDGSGYFNFEDRHHRSTATHQTSQATFDNTMSNMTYSLNPRNIYNIVKVTVTPWTVQSIQELWRLQDEPIIPASETYTYWGDASYSGTSVFVDSWTTPISTTDYQAWTGSGGTGTDKTADISIVTTKFAKTIKLAVTNGASVPVYLYLLKARGTYYDDQTKVTLKAEDSTSQTNYQKRTFQLDGKYITDSNKARDYVTYAIGKYKDPRAELSMSAMNQNTTVLAQILGLEISDRITVVNTELGLNDDYFIDSMEHDISMSGKLHAVNYRLADTINEDFWCLDYSALASSTTSGQTKLGY